MAESQRSEHYTNVRLADDTHGRLKAHNRRGENLSGTVARALDALEREQSQQEALAEMVGDKRANGEFVVVDWDGEING